LILLPTFESAGRVAKVKQKIGSETSLLLRNVYTMKRRSGCYAQGFAGYRLSVQQWTGCDRFTVEQ